MLFIISEQSITPEQFAEVLCYDLDLNAQHFIPAIAQSIRQQIESFPAEVEEVISDQADQRVIIKVSCLVDKLCRQHYYYIICTHILYITAQHSHWKRLTC
jgi:hypothetical protein